MSLHIEIKPHLSLRPPQALRSSPVTAWKPKNPDLEYWGKTLGVASPTEWTFEDP